MKKILIMVIFTHQVLYAKTKVYINNHLNDAYNQESAAVLDYVQYLERNGYLAVQVSPTAQKNTIEDDFTDDRTEKNMESSYRFSSQNQNQ